MTSIEANHQGNRRNSDRLFRFVADGDIDEAEAKKRKPSSLLGSGSEDVADVGQFHGTENVAGAGGAVRRREELDHQVLVAVERDEAVHVLGLRRHGHSFSTTSRESPITFEATHSQQRLIGGVDDAHVGDSRAPADGAVSVFLHVPFTVTCMMSSSFFYSLSHLGVEPHLWSRSS